MHQNQKIMTTDINEDMLRIGRKTAINFLDQWGCSSSQIDQILAEQGLHLRISYILNIHVRLRTLFENQDNVYGFMSKANSNPFFAGRSPLELILSGNLITLKSVYEHIECIGEL